MNQALHIFRKDVRFLRLEIGVVVALTVLHVAWWSRTNGPVVDLPLLTQALLAIAAIFLIGRLIHAEAIPGDRQFWVTRPYRWKSLLAAKLLFIALCVDLPILAIRLVGLLAMGFSLASIVPGLLWSHFLLFVAVGIPVAAVAALTPGMALFVLCLVTLMGSAGIVTERALYLGNRWMESFEWIRMVAIVVSLLAITISVLCLQYKNRRTPVAWAFAVMTASVVIAAYWYTPIAVGMAAQAWMSPQPSEARSVGIDFHQGPGKLIQYYSVNRTAVPLEFRIEASGAAEAATRIDAFKVTFLAPDGKSWDSGWNAANWRYNPTATPGDVLTIDSEFFAKEHEQPVTLHLSTYITLFRTEGPKDLTLGQEPTEIMGGMLCSAGGELFNFRGEPYQVSHCRTPFDWPNRLIHLDPGAAGGNFSSTRFFGYDALSYSPFPSAGINLASSQTNLLTASGSPNMAMTVLTPVAHFRRDLQMTGVRLDDFVKRP